MFMGEYNFTLDPKNRVSVPAKFREELGEKFVISSGMDGCLYLTTTAYWEEFSRKLSELPGTQEARMLQRFFNRNASEIEIDKQGRVLIPQKLKELAKLEKDVVVIGNGNKVEIWSEEKLDSMEFNESMESIAEKMSVEYGFKF